MVDLSRSIRCLLEATIEQARHAEARNEWEAAASRWEEAAKLSTKVAETSPSPAEQEMRANAANNFLQHAKRLRARPVGSPAGQEIQSRANGLDADEDLAHTVRAMRHHSTIKWQEIAGLDDTIRSIQSAYALAVARPPVGIQLRTKSNLLFYGPPGCGKSLLASAASNGLDAAFFNVSVSGLVSKWFGESAKLVSALFQEARRHDVSVVFLDEIDALAASRDQQDSNAARQILANLLSELDGVASKDQSTTVITIGATNSPWDLDAAILSRFSHRIYLPLPDEAARRQMLEIHLFQRGFTFEDDVDSLVLRTAGFSGREIRQICDALVERMLWRENPQLTDLASRGREALAAYTFRVSPLRQDDVESILAGTRPQTSSSLLAKYEQWNVRA